MGKALSTFATLGFVVMTWVVMGLLLLRRGSQQALVGWVPAATSVVYFLSGAAAIASVFLLNDPKRIWPVVIPIMAPLLIIGYVVCVYQPTIRTAMVNPAIGGLVWALCWGDFAGAMADGVSRSGTKGTVRSRSRRNLPATREMVQEVRRTHASAERATFLLRREETVGAGGDRGAAMVSRARVSAGRRHRGD